MLCSVSYGNITEPNPLYKYMLISISLAAKVKERSSVALAAAAVTLIDPAPQSKL